jgi:hypothetical protein
MGMSAADAPQAKKAGIIIAAPTQPAIFNPHLAAKMKWKPDGRDDGLAAARGVGQEPLPKPHRFEERQQLSQQSSIVSLMGPALKISRMAHAPLSRIKSRRLDPDERTN